jgi:hypothetical protein
VKGQLEISWGRSVGVFIGSIKILGSGARLTNSETEIDNLGGCIISRDVIAFCGKAREKRIPREESPFVAEIRYIFAMFQSGWNGFA